MRMPDDGHTFSCLPFLPGYSLPNRQSTVFMETAQSGQPRRPYFRTLLTLIKSFIYNHCLYYLFARSVLCGIELFIPIISPHSRMNGKEDSASVRCPFRSISTIQLYEEVFRRLFGRFDRFVRFRHDCRIIPGCVLPAVGRRCRVPAAESGRRGLSLLSGTGYHRQPDLQALPGQRYCQGEWHALVSAGFRMLDFVSSSSMCRLLRCLVSSVSAWLQYTATLLRRLKRTTKKESPAHRSVARIFREASVRIPCEHEAVQKMPPAPVRLEAQTLFLCSRSLPAAMAVFHLGVAAHETTGSTDA